MKNKNKLPFSLLLMVSGGSFNSEKDNSFRSLILKKLSRILILDPGGKKAPYPRSRSAILV
jgi:hypothetical protein